MRTPEEILGEGEWREEPIPHRALNPATGDVVLVTDGTRRFVRKTLRRPGNGYGDAPGHFDYWEREALAYQSNFVADAPRLVAMDREPDAWHLWLEWAGDPCHDLLAIAQAASELNRPLDEPPPQWASIGWMRSWVDSLGDLSPLFEDDAFWSHPLVDFGDFRAVFARHWANREGMLHVYECLPRVRVHGDLHRANAFWHDGRVRFIDWGYARVGVRGEEIAHLVTATQAEFVGEAPEVLTKGAIAAYGDDAASREGFALGAILRRGFALVRCVTWPQIPNVEEAAPARFGRPFAEVMANRSELARFLSRIPYRTASTRDRIGL